VWLAGLEAFDGRLELGRRMAERAHGVYEEFGYRMALACGCCAVLAEIEVLAGRLEQAEAALRSSCDQLEAMQERACLASRAAELADVIYRRGGYEEAERWHAVARQHAATDDVGAQFLIGAIGAKIHARQGSFGEAERVARAAVRLAEQTDALNNRGKVHLDLAEVLGLQGRSDEAEASVALAVEQFERKGNRVAAQRARPFLEQGRR
jgi:ATP/maltotriose-dependent transcriptional regulator MalT